MKSKNFGVNQFDIIENYPYMCVFPLCIQFFILLPTFSHLTPIIISEDVGDESVLFLDSTEHDGTVFLLKKNSEFSHTQEEVSSKHISLFFSFWLR
jgi:hypothetical protein